MATKLTPAEWTKEWNARWIALVKADMTLKQAQRTATAQMRAQGA